MDTASRELDMILTSRRNRRKLREARKRRRRRRIRNSILALFLIFIIIGTIGVGMIRIGVFPGIQNFLVTSAMTTLSHKYIANIVASDGQIKKIMDSNRVVENYAKFDKNKIKEDTVSDKVELTDISRDGYRAYMLTISNPKRVYLATSQNLGSYGQKISQIVNSHNALAGINAGGFADANGKGKGGTPTGIIIEDGVIKYIQSGLTSFHIIGFTSDGILVIGQYTLDQIKQLNLRDAVDFHPFLIVNGVPTKMYGNGGWGTGPRTAIGQKADGTVIFVVVDGRQIESPGATMKQMQDIMIENGAVNAANLDGGSSTVMYFKDKIINSPSSIAGDRYLPSAFLVNGEGLKDENIINNLGN